MKEILFCLLLILTTGLYGQEYKLPLLLKEGHSAKAFAPEGWFVSDSIYGDLNKDTLIDKVFILEKIDSVMMKNKEGNSYKTNPQILVIALKDKAGEYLLAASNGEILINYNVPPTYSPPLEAMTIENSVLILKFSFDYISGNFYFYTYKYRFQTGKFLLIGAEAEYVARRTMDFQKDSYNFLTRKRSLSVGTYTNEDTPKLSRKMEWFNLEIDVLKTFDSMSRPRMWEVIKGKWL